MEREPFEIDAEDNKRILYSGNHDEVVEVLQGEYALTSASDKKPVLATYGIGPCVALLGWSPKDKVGFMAHYDNGIEMGGSFGGLLYWISESIPKLPADFDIRILQGDWPDQDLVRKVKSRLNIRPDISMKVIEEDIGGVMSKNIALDTRTGETYGYNPMNNPNKRNLTELDKLRIMLRERDASLVYAPKKT